MSWRNTISAGTVSAKYKCGWCENLVASNVGSVDEKDRSNQIVICPHCNKPTFLNSRDDIKVPGDLPGNSVKFVPEEIRKLYNEARKAASVDAFTASVLSCRKILMHIAVHLGANENKSFAYYVQYISDQGYVPPNGKDWVDYIREKGNDANHEIVIMEKNDADDLITFIEMLLKFNYEFPNRIPETNKS